MNDESVSKSQKNLAKRINVVRRRIEVLAQRAKTASGEQQEVLNQAMVDLYTTLDELQRGAEELRARNEELLSTRQLLAAEQQRYQELFEFAPEGYLVTDAAGTIQEANLAAETLLNRRRKYLAGKALSTLVIEEDRPTFRQQLSRLRHTGGVSSEGFAVRLRRDGGGIFDGELAVTAIRDKEGRLTGLRWLLRNVSTHMQADRALRASEASLQAILGNSLQSFALTDREGKLRAFNRVATIRTQFVFGRPLAIGDSIFDFVGEQDNAALRESFARALDGESVVMERQIRAADGTARWFEFNFVPVREQGNVITGVCVSTLDIDARKRAETALRESEAKARSILDAAVDGIVTIDERGVIQSYNPAAERLFGYSSAEAIGQRIQMLMPSPERDSHDNYIANYLKTGVKKIIGVGREVIGQRKDGSVFPMDLAVSEVRIGSQRFFTGIVHDVTERKRAQGRLALQYAVTRVLAGSPSLAEAGPSFLQAICDAVGWDLGELWHVDAASNSLRWSATWHRPTLDAAAFVALSERTTFVPGDGLPGRVWAAGEPAWIADIQSASGIVRLSLMAGLGLTGAFGFPIRTENTVVGVMVFLGRERRDPEPEWLQTLDVLGRQIGDFIERKRAEQVIRDSETRFLTFMNNSPTVQWIKDEAGQYVYINAAYERHFHISLAAIRGRTDFDIFSREIAQSLRANDLAALEGNRTIELFETVPAPQGGPSEWMTFKFPFTDAQGRRFVGGVAIDITERRRAEAKLRELEKLAQQRERLADIGAITAQIVHDVGNPLAGISMQAQLILHRAQRDDSQPLSTIVKPAERIFNEVQRLDSLVKEFMEFSHDQRLDLKPVDLPRFLQHVADLWQPVAAERGIALVIQAQPAAPPLTADEEKLRRVLDNLVKNAIEAIHEGPGRVEVDVTLQLPDSVRFVVSDTGPGIPDSVQVFRLFETTKLNGSGIGLAVARQIVLAHHGTIEFARLSPHGTAFRVELPCSGPLT